MDTLIKMFKIQLSNPTRYTQVAIPALSMILRDLTTLWISLSEGMICMLDLFFNLPTMRMPQSPTSLNALRFLAVDQATTMTAEEVEEAAVPCATVTTKTTQISLTAGDMDLEEVEVNGN